MSLTLSIDAMGGDIGLTVTVPAALRFLKTHADCSVILVGNQVAIQAELDKLGHVQHDRLRIHHASQVVDMDEAPQSAMKNKKDSSMRLAINLVKEGQAQAIVSAGNTGALMATAKFVLKTIQGIDRPAIAKMLPSSKQPTCVLDLGANVDCSPEQLVQFAIMGSELVCRLYGRENPKVGLLNVGEEEIKGNEMVKKTALLLKKTDLNFYGNVEGDDIFKGTTDVVVCDGFVGNIALKASEGLAKMLGGTIKDEFSRNWYAKLAALVALPVLKRFKSHFDTRRYNGASLLGLRGVVIKSHGGTDAVGFEFALVEAYLQAKANVIGHIEEHVAIQMSALETVDLNDASLA
jgi:glycerol-3-phosphate acyltransferase PlsX